VLSPAFFQAKFCGLLSIETGKEHEMHRHLLRLAAQPVRQRPAKVVALDVRREARVKAAAPAPPAPRAA
jgi:hypothetical protein